MIFFVRLRILKLNYLNVLEDNTRTFLIEAQNRNECEDKIDRLTISFKLPDKSIIQVLSIKQQILNQMGIGEII